MGVYNNKTTLSAMSSFHVYINYPDVLIYITSYKVYTNVLMMLLSLFYQIESL